MENYKFDLRNVNESDYDFVYTMDEEQKAILIYLDDCMLLSKKEYSCWQEVRGEYYEKYKTNFAPMSCEEIMSFFNDDFKQEENWPFSRERIIEFFKGNELVIQSKE